MNTRPDDGHSSQVMDLMRQHDLFAIQLVQTEKKKVNRQHTRKGFQHTNKHQMYVQDCLKLGYQLFSCNKKCINAQRVGYYQKEISKNHYLVRKWVR